MAEGIEVSKPLFIGVDVGSGSSRAALVDSRGKILHVSECELMIWEKNGGTFCEQSSENIWSAVAKVVNGVLIESNYSPDDVIGIGFDATCSLVALGDNFQPLSVSESDDDTRNVIMWMDHRATAQAQRITAKSHPVLRNTGGSMSPEMQPPKLLWLKENLPENWARFRHFFDLPDFLTWKATGSVSRSLCSLACKWTLQANEENVNGYWDYRFWEEIGLADLTEENFNKIGNDIRMPGASISGGLSDASADDLGLKPGTAVGVSLIDAHAGGIGLLGADIKSFLRESEDDDPDSIRNRLALICGTSSCLMVVSAEATYYDGIWGPYYSAMVPNMWLNESGQSAAGKLIDHVVKTHPSYPELQRIANENDENIYSFLNKYIVDLGERRGLAFPEMLAKDLHVYPDFHGNRSPLADPGLKGMICGLRLSVTLDDLACLYVATVMSLAFQVRHIVSTLETARNIKTIFACGGLSKNPFYVEVHATVNKRKIFLPKEPESVLVGASILGACAAGAFDSIETAMAAMCAVGQVVEPQSRKIDFYERKFEVFMKMLNDQQFYDNVMTGKKTDI